MADFGKDGLNSGSSGKLRTNFLAQPKFLKAPVLSNPFAKPVADDSSSSKSDIKNPFAAATSKDPNESLEEVKAETNNTTEEKKPADNDIVPKFVPLHTSKESISFAGGTATATPSGLSRAGGFVFGQNLKERIVGGPENVGEGTSSASSEHSATNGASDFLFAAAVQATTDNQSTSKDTGNSLAKSTQVWERVRDTSGPVAPPPQRVLTGEEGEINQLQMNCRLFAFEGGLWKERGRSQLRLNDSQTGSRLVCRSAGSLRVLLNTKIWAGMTVERPGARSLRVTATDSLQQLKVFLIMASPDEITQLYKYLTRRVEQAANSADTCENTPDNVVEQPDNNDSSISDIEKSNAESGDEKLNISEENTSQSILDSNSSNTSHAVPTEDNNGDESANREALKRPLPEEGSSIPKKMCMEFPSEDDVPL